MAEDGAEVDEAKDAEGGRIGTPVARAKDLSRLSGLGARPVVGDGERARCEDSGAVESGRPLSPAGAEEAEEAEEESVCAGRWSECG